MLAHNGDIFAVEPPMFVELVITETEPGFKGRYSNRCYKACYS